MSLQLRKGFADRDPRAPDPRLDLGDRTVEPLPPFFDAFVLFTRSGRKPLDVGREAGAEREEAGKQALLGFELASRRADKAFGNAHERDYLIFLLTSG